MQSIAILGSTGSIGRNSLEVVKGLARKFRVLALSTYADIATLEGQIRQFHPEYVCVHDEKAWQRLKRNCDGRVQIYLGREGLEKIIRDQRIKKIILAISGSAALEPLLGAIEADKDICLANKEALVMAGPLIMNRVTAKKVRILPIDSEQSAIWQCLEGRSAEYLKRIYLTASGGPLRGLSVGQIKQISLKRVLQHPRWKMGKKITVDSADLMNKGLELLEAMYLFAVPCEKIKILIHPEAIIHSMVEFVDGVVLAQLSTTDMRIPIQYALTHPERLPNRLKELDFCKIASLNFEEPDLRKFPCLGLALQAARQGATLPCVLNAANEVCVEHFLKRELKFSAIPAVLSGVLSRHKKVSQPDLNDILHADAWARVKAEELIGKRN